MNFLPQFDAAAIFAEHLAWAAHHAEPLTAQSAPHDNDRTADRRLRIGYVSPHFRQHAVNFFVEPVLLAHDHEQFEVFCYSSVARPDAVTQRLQASADHWRDVTRMSDEAIAQLVRGDAIDILVDLSGHMGWHRLMAFARKPAPVQVTYIGYQNTTGMSAMDYRLTDEQADPPGLTDAYYTEHLLRLPRCFFCYQPSAAPDVTPLPARGNGYVTFGSFNNYAKIMPETVDVWLEILSRVPNSRLLVLNYRHGYLERHLHAARRRAWAGRRTNRAGHALPARGLSAAHPRRRYRARPLPVQRPHHDVRRAVDGRSRDQSLRTDLRVALWRLRLAHVGLQPLITDSVDAYIAAAADLAQDLDQLADLRRQLRPRMAASALLDFEGFTRNLEAAYRQMWRRWCVAGGDR